MKKHLVLFFLLIAALSYAQNQTITSQTRTATPNAPLKIGDEVTTTIHTQHPYNTTGTEGVVFEKEFFNKHSAYIKIHFKNFSLAKGDYVQIISPNTGESVVYAGQGKIIDEDLNTISNFWSQALFDERVIVRLFSTTPSNSYGFDINIVAYGYPQTQIDQILSTKAICGGDEKEPVVCRLGTTMYEKSRAVCRLIINGTGACTGWLLGCNGHIMTNNHCIGNATDAANTDFLFNYQYTNCNGTGNATNDAVASSSTFIKTNSTLDYTLVQLPVNPTPTYGFLSLSSVAPVVNDRIYIVGHPGGRRKEITVITDQGGDANGNAIVNQVTTNGIRYYADTEGGSSGSPVLDYSSNLVVAIHNTGGCTNGSNGRSNKLITAIGSDMPSCGIDDANIPIISSCNSTVSSFPYSESFENTIGLWSQANNDNLNWTVKSGGTPSGNTGPAAANAGNYYIYVEASSPNYPSKTAILNSPCFNLSGLNNPVLSFDYNMNGGGMGSVELQVSSNGGIWTTMWSRAGNQGTAWHSATVNLAAYINSTDLKFRIVGTTGTSYQSDMAIDAFVIQNVAPPCNTVSNFPYRESFENTLGLWSQYSNDDLDWTIQKGGTPSGNTGPAAANAGAYYIYVEASSPNYPSKRAVLSSPCFDLSSLNNPELSFDYHMFGSAMGYVELQVSSNGGSWTTLWTKSGDQGNVWHSATVNLAAYVNSPSLKFRITGTTGFSYQSDMSIDNFSIKEAMVALCNQIYSFPYTQSFENTLGLWTQNSTDDIDWTIQSGGTPSANTGPSSANLGSYYIYIEASSPNYPSKRAILTSPCFDMSFINNPELTFDYNMYGKNTGTLLVQVSDNGGSWTTIWSKSGNQGTGWKQASISLSAYTNSPSLKFRLNGNTGNSFRGDMSIDAFSVHSFGESSNLVLDVDKVEPISYLDVQPNPFHDYIEISSNIEGLSSYTIVNVQGQNVQSGTIQNQTIRVNELSTGVYFIQFTNGKEHITRKIVKQ